MFRSIKIMLPILPPDHKEIYFKGYIDTSLQYALTVYITEYTTNKNLFTEKYNMKDIIHGHVGGFQQNQDKINNSFCNYLVLERDINPRINTLIIDRRNIETDDSIIILYDYYKIKNSETVSDFDDHFSKLRNLIQDVYGLSQSQTTYTPILNSSYWLASSMFTQHLFNYMNLINWLVSTIRRDKKVSIKQGNLILAIIIDIILGYIMLELLTKDKKELGFALMGVLEKLVNSLYSLLKWLMGSPAGLKLNNAFNKMLGKYFSYHIQLWWLFLDVSGEKLDTILHIYHYVGYLGFTFQAAIISDMLCIATFHSYCIYVYAARLFNIQISGLIALLRLFVGRKYNPLRGGIDSCEYTNQELFVGTVAFTILLLLLPTTAMYYIVFTLFRLLSLVVQHILAKLIYFIQTLPLYVAVLWIAQSPKVAGNILIEVARSEKGTPLILKMRLLKKSIHDLVNNFKPPVQVPKQFEWTNILSNIFIGKQII